MSRPARELLRRARVLGDRRQLAPRQVAHLPLGPLRELVVAQHAREGAAVVAASARAVRSARSPSAQRLTFRRRGDPDGRQALWRRGIRAEVAARRRRARRGRARDRARRRRPGVGRLHPAASTDAAQRGRDRRRSTTGCRPTSTRRSVLELVAELNADDARRRRARPDCRCRRTSTRRASSGAVDPVKDVDGFHPLNAGRLYLGRPAHVPATPLGIMALLREYDVPLEGARAVVRRPQRRSSASPSRMLLAAGERDRHDLPLAHAATSARHTREADILVAAVGSAAARHGRTWSRRARRWSTSGITRTDAGLVGDVDPGAAERRGVPDAGSGRRRPDDDRDAARQHGSGRALPPRAACLSRRRDARLRALQ